MTQRDENDRYAKKALEATKKAVSHALMARVAREVNNMTKSTVEHKKAAQAHREAAKAHEDTIYRNDY